MALLHNLYLRGINAIYLQCINVERSPADVPAFVKFALAWGTTLEGHHENEEDIVFPGIEKATGVEGIMAANKQQHEAFHAGLEAYVAYVTSVNEGKEKYDGQKLMDIIDSFGSAMREHLVDEIATLKALDKYDVPWLKHFKEWHNAIIKIEQAKPNSMDIGLPFSIMCNDATYHPETFSVWPPGVPWIVMAVMRWMFFGKNKAMWQFAPCDGNQKPKDLPFAE
jgi:hypothetical protein